MITKVKLLPRSDNHRSFWSFSWYKSISCSTVPHLPQLVSCFSSCLTMCHFSNHQSLYHVNITMHHLCILMYHCVSSCIIVYHHVTSCIIVYHPLQFYELSSLVTVSHCITTYVLHCCPLVSALQVFPDIFLFLCGRGTYWSIHVFVCDACTRHF